MSSDIDLLSRCAEFTLLHSHEVEENVLKELEISARTSLVTALRMLRLQRALLAIGMFSLFESLLRGRMERIRPFDRLKKYLDERGICELAQNFEDYRLAINVLKHGEGKSYDRLLAKRERLEFKIKPQNESFFDEGDVSEVEVLVDVDERFVRRCAELIQEIWTIIRSEEGDFVSRPHTEIIDSNR